MKIKFKVGDRIKCVGRGHSYQGRCGTVLEPYMVPDGWLRIRLDGEPPSCTIMTPEGNVIRESAGQ